jgi:hypothetical protein
MAENSPPDGDDRTRRDERQDADGSGTLVSSDQEAYVGDTIEFHGRDLAPNERFGLVWHTVEGSWGVLQAHEIVGSQFRPRRETIATVETDADGTFDETWTIPEDFGSVHTVALTDAAGEQVADTEVEISPWFELDRTTTELGEFFTVTGYGIGPGVMVNNYQVAWDNTMVGFLTGVQNRGTATAKIRAVGPPGKNVIQVWRGYRGMPFLQNNTQSPYGEVADGRQTAWTVEVTPPESDPRTAWIDAMPEESPLSAHYPEIDEDTGATLSVTPEYGQAGDDVFVTGENFPAHTEVDLVWYHHSGHEPRGPDKPPLPTITAEPWPDELPTVETDADGSFRTEVTVPVDIGSTRPITAAVDGREVAVTGFMMQPSIETFEPTSGPVGTNIEIELTGVGWTQYEMAPLFVYDNDPLGYACGLSDKEAGTTIRTILQASGQPGWHFIDAYPTLFRTQQDEPEFELRSHLSYLDNHPMRPVPAFHFAFEVTE